MTRRELVAWVALAPAAQAQVRRRPTGRKPNILMIMADQHRFDCVGAYGNKAIHTPHIDRIAREGVRFDCAYSSTPTCTPARAALLTGLSPWHHGMLAYSDIAERYPLEKPRALAEAGYQTTTIGKNHFYPMRNSHGYQQMLTDEHCSYWAPGDSAHQKEASPEARCDYEAWFWSQNPLGDPHATGLSWNDYRAKPFVMPERLHATKWTGDVAVNYLESYDRDQPFFLKVSFIRPHSPYDPPERLMRKYQGAAIPEARAAKWAQKYEPRSGPDNEIWHGKLPAAEIRQSREGYYASVEFVDEQVGRILAALEKKGMLEETLIIFFSDHGDMLGDHNLWRKSYPWEASSRIPMVMRWPEGLVQGKRGIVSKQPVELRDILPTFLEVAGAKPSRPLDGRSLLQLAAGKTEGWREWIDLEHSICYSPTNNWNALCDGKIKYIYSAFDGTEQLFNLAKDPGEMTDLAGNPAHASTLGLWRGRLVEHLAERGERYVKDGTLIARPKGVLTAPHFPGWPEHPHRPGLQGRI